ncbi:septal ring lytic transglycosylase RlpA family protein [Kordiimonas sp. SCSIO 12610]|uniref:septal ring lytic transglycosylase RlpA family protein n=1 Tax=Kordiimonas sp. SCSIO 12610 TaxID=2829597 RepID=UPI00272E39D1|nr:septal ring lytic transglycosylase RlpA family protein [Kordiimonas sp. SCSIO 12610]
MYKSLSLILFLLFLAACSTTPSVRPPNDNELPKGDQGGAQKVGKPYKIAGKWYYPKEDPTYDEVGLASWYGRQFHGRKTANGEVYNMNSLTAAHKTLPLPSFVKVTNLANGRSIVLRVNDRGPFIDSRIIDVSRRGAQLLGFQKQGVTRVRVQASDANGNVVNPLPTRQYAEAPDDAEVTHFVQIGSFSKKSSADEQARMVLRAGETPKIYETIIDGRKLWRVRIGPLLSRNLAQEILDRLVGRGFYETRIFTEQKR